MPIVYRLSAIVLLLVTASWPQAGTDKNRAAPPNRCPNANTTLEINQCFASLERTADVNLNAVYQKIGKEITRKISQEQDQLKGYQERALAKLKAAETAWIHYRDAQCDAAEQQYEGGTVSESVRLGCMLDLTEQRTKELQQTYAIYLQQR